VALIFSVATILAITGIPASATPVGTATLTSGLDILAGSTDAPFTLQVRNTGTQVIGESVNFVSILVPNGLTVVDGSSSGWTRDVRQASNRVLFSGGSIAPGSNANFTVFADVARPAADSVKRWSISISSDAGNTASSVNPIDGPTGTALNTTVRVLQVLSAQLSGPSQAVDNTVTSGQNNTTAQTVVQNAGSAALVVHPTLAVGGGGSTTQNTVDTSIAPNGGTQSFNFGVTFGSAGTTMLSAGASATGASALGANSPSITVQSPAALSYTSSSLTPKYAIPGRSYGFALGLTKSGTADVTFTAASSRLTFGSGAYSAALVSPTSPATGANQFQFASATVPAALSDGNYQPNVSLSGVDSNGWPVTITPQVTDNITLDSSIPLANLSITLPASKVAGENPAASNGKQVTFSGTVTDGGSTCGTCIVSGTVLQQYSNGTPGATIPVTLTNNNGTLSGSYSGNYANGVDSIALVATVSDLAGNAGPSASSLAAVDNVAPFLATYATGGPNHSDTSRIDITFSEPVATNAPMSAADWKCDNHNIVAAQQNSSKQLANTNFTSVTLTANPAVGQDERPACHYAPNDNNRALDRTGSTNPNTDFAAADGILPPAPTIDSVAGLAAASDGKFYTNQSAPAFVVSNTAAGNTVTLYRDSNNNGSFDSGDAQIGTASVPTGNTVTIQSQSLGTANGPVTIFVRGIDGAGNAGAIGAITVVLDFVPPTVASFSATGSSVTVTFSEPLRFGRNAFSDWVVYHRNSDGTFTGFQLGSVSGSGTTRTLTINDSGFTTGTTIDRIQYDFAGAVGQRYQDNAGNDLVNFTATN